MIRIDAVCDIVRAAGDAALKQWGNIEAKAKPDQSLVTEVDLATERFLEEELRRLAPEYAFVGEEYGWRGSRSAPVWACDPIDGTTNYVFGLPHWGVSVGLLEGGTPVLGAIYLPVLNEMFAAVRGQGATCNGRAIRCPDRDALGVEDTIVVTSNAAKTLNVEAIPGRLRCLGSIAAELAYTARGSMCATIGLREGIVDVAAALAICFEAGCRFHYLHGPEVDVGALLEARHTREHFVYAPPNLLRSLQATLKPIRVLTE